MLFLYVAILFFIYLIINRRLGGISFISLSSLYVFINYFVYFLVSILGVDKSYFNLSGVSLSAMPVNDYTIIQSEVFFVFLTTMIVMMLSAFSVSKKKTLKVKLRDFQAYFTNIDEILIRYKYYILIYSLVIFLLSIIHFLSIDYDLLYLNYEYQTIKEPEKIGIDNDLLRFFHLSFRVFGLMSLVMFLYACRSKFYIIATLLFMSFSYAFFLLLIANSRWVFLYSIFAFFISLLIFKRKTLPLFFLFLSALSLAKVMLGRGQSTQGISAISEQFSLVWDVGIFNVFFMSLYNLAEGGLNIANSFLIDQRHSELYKILSFSPLPSFIDGFSSISETESIRLHTYVPMSGISEVYLFGGVYPFVFYFFLYIIFVNVERLRFTKGPGLYVLFSVITLYSVSTLFSYSLRTTWKIMLLILVVSFLLNLTGRKSLK